MTYPDPMTVEDAARLGVIGKIVVRLDGVSCQDVIAYSIKEGWVMVYCRDEDGDPIPDGESWAIKRLTGVVETEGL